MTGAVVFNTVHVYSRMMIQVILAQKLLVAHVTRVDACMYFDHMLASKHNTMALQLLLRHMSFATNPALVFCLVLHNTFAITFYGVALQVLSTNMTTVNHHIFQMRFRLLVSLQIRLCFKVCFANVTRKCSSHQISASNLFIVLR
jgi:hypothetical protein